MFFDQNPIIRHDNFRQMDLNIRNDHLHCNDLRFNSPIVKEPFQNQTFRKVFEPITLPKFDFPKPNLDFSTPKVDTWNHFDLDTKRNFDGGAVNIIQQQQQMMGPPLGSPPIMKTGPQLFI